MPSGSREITVSAWRPGMSWCHLPIQFWVHFGGNNRWITASHPHPVEDRSSVNCTLFQPVFQVSNSNRIVRLRHVNTGFNIEEPVDSRTISNVRYRLSDARIYNERTTGLITDEAVNRLHVPVTSELNLTETVTNTTNWSRSVTLTIGVTISGSAGIPFVANSWDWGTTSEETQEVGSVRTVDVPPMSRVRGTLMATRLSFDVPFTYTQRDVMKNGKIKVYQKDDGLFTGHNGYGYYYEVVPLPLD
ncbi:hypothetical protein MKX03_015722 [Papaver bracteatum]|nr:hypothetical protein MKX03_015722 [Papaver bracteatum]